MLGNMDWRLIIISDNIIEKLLWIRVIAFGTGMRKLLYGGKYDNGRASDR